MKKIVTGRETNGSMSERVWHVEHVFLLTSAEMRKDGEKLDVIKPMLVGRFESEEEIIEFITGTGDSIISEEET